MNQIDRSKANLLNKLRADSLLVRVVPFVIFLGLTFFQGKFGEASRYWFYLAKTLVGGWMVLAIWPAIKEMRWGWSWDAVAVGVGVFAVWVGLDGLYPSINGMMERYGCPVLRSVGLESWCPKESANMPPWNPHAQFGESSLLAWLFVVARIAGSTLVVPPLEETFYRSFAYRYLIEPDFQKVSSNTLRWGPFIIVAVVFGISHFEWLPGILCGLAYQGLVCWKGRLADAITAHAITNFLLGLWVVWRGAWHFW